MQLKAYVPNAKFFIGVVLVLAVLAFALRTFKGNATVAKVATYLGLAA